jgi:hypothetical protein
MTVYFKKQLNFDEALEEGNVFVNVFAENKI